MSTIAPEMTKEERRAAGLSHLQYMKELLQRDGDDAKLELHAAHMRSVLAAATPTANEAA